MTAQNVFDLFLEIGHGKINVSIIINIIFYLLAVNDYAVPSFVLTEVEP